MITDKTKFQSAIQLMDEANKADPNRETWEGKAYPKELLYAQRMTACLDQFEPNASEALQLAARSQHICRWEIPRANYPKTRLGYTQWRNQLKSFHAQKAGEILKKAGYDEEMIARVQFLILKKRLKLDAETQTLEDVICLVFLTYYLKAFATQNTTEKLIGILRKTWRKMSDRGQKTALEWPLPPKVKQLLRQALE